MQRLVLLTATLVSVLALLPGFKDISSYARTPYSAPARFACRSFGPPAALSQFDGITNTEE